MAQMVAVEGTSLYEAEAEFRRRFVTMVLKSVGGNRTRAAERLAIGRTMLHKIIKNYGIDVPPPRQGEA